MTLWQLEIARLLRTRRALVLAALFTFLGCTAPLLEHYAADILASATSDGVRVELPPPTPADGIASYESNAQQLGLIGVVVVASSALCFHARPQAFVFYRMRVARRRDMVVPRYVVVVGACVAAYLLGLFGAWYETTLLIGDPGVPRTLAHGGLMSLHLAFVVAGVAFIASFFRSVLASVGSSLGVYLVALPALSVVDFVEPWTPQALADSAAPLVSGSDGLGHYVVPAAVSAGLTVLLLAVSIQRVQTSARSRDRSAGSIPE
ncbi:hypothetical protein GCM10012286_04100 [Streptomyces lasiicapitis]|uniref:ABC transporter permease n=1 Tax=Streptomyces lasiicapitis TaxID=1923961 RepID=A0ABQ2LHU4_9ACTN|nr:hypothetical protein GCM10012286_04100 [Streptomyces lasiicapitis]